MPGPALLLVVLGVLVALEGAVIWYGLRVLREMRTDLTLADLQCRSLSVKYEALRRRLRIPPAA